MRKPERLAPGTEPRIWSVVSAMMAAGASAARASVESTAILAGAIAPTLAASTARTCEDLSARSWSDENTLSWADPRAATCAALKAAIWLTAMAATRFVASVSTFLSAWRLMVASAFRPSEVMTPVWVLVRAATWPDWSAAAWRLLSVANCSGVSATTWASSRALKLSVERPTMSEPIPRKSSVSSAAACFEPNAPTCVAESAANWAVISA